MMTEEEGMLDKKIRNLLSDSRMSRKQAARELAYKFRLTELDADDLITLFEIKTFRNNKQKRNSYFIQDSPP